MTSPALASDTAIHYVGLCPHGRDCTWTQTTAEPFPTPHCDCEETP
jgi:hypothetical protein